MKSITFFVMALAIAVLATVGVYGEWGGEVTHAQGAGPAPPTNVTATTAGSSVTVSWTNSPDAAGHLVMLFRSDWSGDPLVATPTGSAHTFNSVPDGSYIALAVAFDASSNIIFAISNIVTVNASAPAGTPSPTPTPTPTPGPADQPPCPMPGSPAAATPPPRPTSVTPGDYDADDDGLIEVANLAQLDAIRYDPWGKGTPRGDDDDLESYFGAFPNAVAGMGCPADGGCAGYELVADLDFGANPVNWVPIEEFGSTFDGNHHTISNLFIDRKIQEQEDNKNYEYVGLFGDAGGAAISSVGLVSVNVSNQRDIDSRYIGTYVGGLAGRARSISDSYVTGVVSNTRTTYVGRQLALGGLVGGTGRVTDSCTAVRVTDAGRAGYEHSVGGLVGFGIDYRHNTVTITGSYATGDISGSGGNVGGLVGSRGDDTTTISGSYFTGAVTGGGDNVGGLVGSGNVGITESYVTGAVTGGEGNVGGLVGSGNVGITESYVTGAVTGGRSNVGGLVGSWQTYGSIIEESYTTGAVTGRHNVGGLVGSGSHRSSRGGSNITGSYATGTVTGGGTVGGLVGSVGANVTISGSHATGAVTGEDNVGGLVGSSRSVGSPYSSSITGSYATGDVSGGGNSVGGLVGSGYSSSITGSYAKGAVSGGGDNVGGLVGNGGIIAGSYATGNVSGVGNSVGGLVGYSNDSITASYAKGDVSGNFRVGGLVGLYHGGRGDVIVASYSIGSVTGKGAVGGLVGSNTGAVTDSYWDTTASGAQHSDGGTGKTTAELQAPTSYTGIYANWNLDLDNRDRDDNAATGGDDPWDFGTSSQYPVLKYGGPSVASQRGAASGGG